MLYSELSQVFKTEKKLKNLASVHINMLKLFEYISWVFLLANSFLAVNLNSIMMRCKGMKSPVNSFLARVVGCIKCH